jgi:hypothetical protein
MSTIWTTNSRTSRKSYDDWRTLARSDVAVTASDAATEIQRATGQAVAGRRAGLLGAQKPLWDVWSDHCFRVEVEGWQRLPGGPGRGRVDDGRVDVCEGLVRRAVGVIPASRAGVSAALAAGRDVVVWPSGEQDAMRAWCRRNQATLAGRMGFVRQAIRSRVPIVPVAAARRRFPIFF